MILANYAIAKFAHENCIMVPYRTQAKSHVPSDVELNCYDDIDIKNSIIRRSLHKAQISLRASPHFSLGLSEYLQVTSPIRRYMDILIHRQITSFLQGSDQLPESELTEDIKLIQTKVREATDLTREDQYNSLLSWLKLQNLKEFKLIFLFWINKSKNQAVTLIKDISTEITVHLINNIDIETGHQLKIRDYFIDEQQNCINLSTL